NGEYKTADDQAQIARYLSYIALASREYRVQPTFRHFTFQIFDDLNHPDVDDWGDFVDHDEVNKHAFLVVSSKEVWQLDDLEQAHQDFLDGVESDDED